MCAVVGQSYKLNPKSIWQSLDVCNVGKSRFLTPRNHTRRVTMVKETWESTDLVHGLSTDCFTRPKGIPKSENFLLLTR